MSTTPYIRLLDIIDTLDRINLGYNQAKRWSLVDKRRKKLLYNKEGDCSAVTWAAYWLAGYPVPDKYIANPKVLCYTGNSEEIAKATPGFRIVYVRGWTLDAIQRNADPGDSLLGDGHIMIMGRNRMWFSMNQDENGNIAGGQPGEQNPNESGFRTLWVRKGGWTCLIKPSGKSTTVPVATNAAVVQGTITVGAKGSAVKALQQGLNRNFGAYSKLVADGIYGPATAAVVREFQKRSGLQADGIVGPKTKAQLARYGVTF